MKDPNQVISNGLCRIHGARLKYCVTCIKLKLKDPKQVQNKGLCINHGARKQKIKLCRCCVKLKLKEHELVFCIIGTRLDYFF